ncbi:30S ribosomal protein S4 [Leekyejoonella antrihumi]|uniref:Small ribosomal subunit protein uS4 n=1 Tax=Leekyejoonella antrihumi TaxID=1660198 RepID=A0A563E587_9MICO|nr:30S ribosomal protein S4 [Leekyejoonella antrihumi]TWP37393.1 30S ribosomal protein S4 [Leekyejoonella antrihumi]
MARYTGPITKKSRRLKTDLVGGDKNFEMRPFPPGQHGRGRIQEKEYLSQLQEKQKARFTYGVMEKQFSRYYKEAARRSGKTGAELLTILESRLDSVVYRAGLARTRRASRQMVTHGHFEVNGQRVDVPSYRVSQYDIITVREKSREKFPIQLARETFGERQPPAWMHVSDGTLQILIHQLPTREQIDTILTEQLIVEYYSKN